MVEVKGLLIFESTNAALKAERILKAAAIEYAVIPTPLEITSECGISILLKEAWVEKSKEALAVTGCDSSILVFPFER